MTVNLNASLTQGFGITSDTSGVLTFQSNAAETMRIDTSGNVGIGTSSPVCKEHVKSSGEILRLETTGTVSSGGAAYQTWYDSTASRQAYIGFGGANNTFQINLDANGPLTFSTNNTERMRITNGGALLVGRTNIVGGEAFGVKGFGTGATWAIYNENSAGSILHAVLNNGAFYTGGAANSPYNNTTASAANCFINSDNGFLQRSTSSLKYKTDVKDATHGLIEVMQLRPVTYKGKNDGDKVFGGLIAEEVDAVGLTEFVQYAEDGSPDALAYGNMVSLLVKAVQELSAKVDAQASEIAALKAKVGA